MLQRVSMSTGTGALRPALPEAPRMVATTSVPSCITYISVPHLGFGFVQNCVSILENFPSDVLNAKLVMTRAFRPISSNVDVRQVIPWPFPFRYARPIEQPALNFFFKRALAKADPRRAVAYFWPSAPMALIRHAKDRGFLTVREMINTYAGTQKAILDEAYGRLGLPLKHAHNEKTVENERAELKSYDFIFAPNPRVEESLIRADIQPSKILRSSYGWSPEKYAASSGEADRRGFRALFVGSLCVRKGLPQLLAAWKKSGVEGELLLVGSMDESVKPLVAPYIGQHGIKHAGFTYDVGRLYKSADALIFPTLEEGDPLVTYEAAGCGLPVITTSMGSANIIKDEVNGLLVKDYDVDGLAEAINRLANSPELRQRLGLQAAKDAKNFTYEKVGRDRARILSGLLTGNSDNRNTNAN